VLSCGGVLSSGLVVSTGELMSVSTITSGELYFRAHEVGKQTSTLNNFRKFLHTDVDRDSLQNEYASSRAYLQKCKMHMRKNVDSSLKNSAELIKLLKLRRYQNFLLL
jgi:hypothetical protein